MTIAGQDWQSAEAALDDADAEYGRCLAVVNDAIATLQAASLRFHRAFELYLQSMKADIYAPSDGDQGADG